MKVVEKVVKQRLSVVELATSFNNANEAYRDAV